MKQHGELGNWSFFDGPIPNVGRVTSVFAVSDGEPRERNIAIKTYERHSHMAISLYCSDWRFPKGSTTRIVLDFQDGEPKALDAATSDEVVDCVLPQEAIPLILYKLGASERLWISFPLLEEDRWTIDLIDAKPSVLQLVAALSARIAGAEQK